MIKVKITFDDKTTDEFYAENSYQTEGNMVYWVMDTGDTISYDSDNIFKIVEREVEE